MGKKDEDPNEGKPCVRCGKRKRRLTVTGRGLMCVRCLKRTRAEQRDR